jgi:hypothetical protein
LHSGDRIAGIGRAREGVFAFDRENLADLHDIEQGRDAWRDVLAVGGDGRERRVLDRAAFIFDPDERRDAATPIAFSLATSSSTSATLTPAVAALSHGRNAACDLVSPRQQWKDARADERGLAATRSAMNKHELAHAKAGYDLIDCPLAPAENAGFMRLERPQARVCIAPNIMKAKSKPLAQKTLADYGVDVTARLKTLKVSEPPKRIRGALAPLGCAARDARRP